MSHPCNNALFFILRIVRVGRKGGLGDREEGQKVGGGLGGRRDDLVAGRER